MKKLLILMILIVGCTKQRIISKGSESDLLKLVESGNISSFKMDTTNPNLVNTEEPLLSDYISKVRMTYPKFDRDLMFSAVAMDEYNQYTVFFRYTDRKCVISTNPTERIKEVNTCYEKFNICMSGKRIQSLTSSDFQKCMNHTECQALALIDKGKIIEKKYCETIYGRKL